MVAMLLLGFIIGVVTVVAVALIYDNRKKK